jgi:hypothetical protein
MRLDKPSLPILVQDSERVPFRLVDDTDSLWTRCGVRNEGEIRGGLYLLKLDEVMELIISDDVRPGSDFCSFAKIFGEHGDLHRGLNDYSLNNVPRTS